MTTSSATESHLQHPLRVSSPELDQLIASIAERESVRESERILPYDVIDSIRKSRLGSVRLTRDEDGSGFSLRQLFSIFIRIAAADANVAHILRNHFVITERILFSPRSERNRRWLRAVAQGAIIGLAGTDLKRRTRSGGRSSQTELEPDGADYRLTCEKYYSTGVLYSDLLAVSLGVQGSPAIAIIPTKREGVELVDDWDGIGQRLTGSGTTRFHNVRIAADELILPNAPDYKVFPYYSTLPQLFVTAVNAGILQAVLRDGVALVHKRGRSFYHAASEHAPDDPLLQQIVGQLSSHAFAAEATVLAAADALDELMAVHQHSDELAQRAALDGALKAAKAKLVVDELVLRGATQVFELGGASSAKRSENLDRHWRNARTLSNHNPVVFKARALGDHHLNGKPLPNQGFF